MRLQSWVHLDDKTAHSRLSHLMLRISHVPDMFFLIPAAFMGVALAGSAFEDGLPVPNRIVRRVTTLTSPVDSQQTGTISYCKYILNSTTHPLTNKHRQQVVQDC